MVEVEIKINDSNVIRKILNLKEDLKNKTVEETLEIVLDEYVENRK